MAHQSLPPKDQGKYSSFNAGEYLVSPFVTAIKGEEGAPLRGLPILSVRGISLRSRVSLRVFFLLVFEVQPTRLQS